MSKEERNGITEEKIKQLEKELAHIRSEIKSKTNDLLYTKDPVQRINILGDLNNLISEEKKILGRIAIGPPKKYYAFGHFLEGEYHK